MPKISGKQNNSFNRKKEQADMNKLTIAGIRRGNQFSPNHVGNDAAIFSLTAEHLRQMGCVVNEYVETDLLLNDPSERLIFNMVRDWRSIRKLQKLEDKGYRVINSGYGIENCTREKMTRLLMEQGIAHPRSLILQTDEDPTEALEKAGFTFEGMMKNNAVKNGKVLDMALYSLTRTMEPYPVRRLTREEIPVALELCWRVFLEFEAPEYSPEGIAAFRASLDNPQRNRQMDFYGAFDGETLVGVLCMRAPQHIAGLFVDAAYHRRGIGRKLFEAMRRDYAQQVFTVNSSPYAVEVYRHLGFVPTDDEQSVDGLRFTPMQYSPKQEKTGITNQRRETYEPC